jgi:hypothetical protein
MSDIRTLFSNPKKRVKLDDQPRESALAPVAASDTFTTFLPEDQDLPDDVIETDSTDPDVAELEVMN